MGRAPCCDKANVKKGPWSPEEDYKLKDYIQKFGTGGNWIALPHKAGLKRCGKSCRLRWMNYLRPNIKHGQFSEEEDTLILNLFAAIGSRWSIIASQLPGRTDNDIKNYWNTKLKKKLMMIPPSSLIQFPSPSCNNYLSSPFLMSSPPLSVSSFCRDNNYPFDPTKPLTTSLDFLSSVPPNDVFFSRSNQTTTSEMFLNQKGSSVIPLQNQGSSSSSSSSMKLDHQTLSVFSDTVIKQETRTSDIDFQSQISKGFERSQIPNQWQETALLEYVHLEDVKGLIGSSNSEIQENSNFFCHDDEESRLEEKSMYYF